jgi:3-methyladenine DNA glycosylase AlkD
MVDSPTSATRRSDLRGPGLCNTSICMKPLPIQAKLRALGDPQKAAFAQRFFRTGPGEYAEGDVFIGVTVPQIRVLAREAAALPMTDLRVVLRATVHEERLLALIALTRVYQRGDDTMKQRVFDLYLAERAHVNNWDLVDTSAPHIAGAWVLDDLSRSPVLWDRRIAVLSTQAFIRTGDFADTLRLCQRLLGDPHDLMHKACGWMLREIGKRDLAILRAFLAAHTPAMPRTMLRYAIEKLPPEERRRIMRR